MSDEDIEHAYVLRRLHTGESMWISGIQIMCCDSTLEVGPRVGPKQSIPRSSGIREVRDAIAAIWEVWSHTQI